MNKKLLLLSAFLAGASWTVLAQDLVLSEGQYYTDETQTTPYTGRYTNSMRMACSRWSCT